MTSHPPSSDDSAPARQIFFAALTLLSFSFAQTTLAFIRTARHDNQADYFTPTLLAAFGFLLVIFLITLACCRNIKKSLTLTLLVSFFAFAYGPAAETAILRPEIVLALALVCPLLLSVAVIKRTAVLNVLHPTLSLFSVFLSLFYFAQVTEFFSQTTNLHKPPEIKSAQHPAQDLPDIYFILLDGYPGQKTLKSITGYDNTPFLHALKKKGFYVAENSRSNYAHTLLSVSSLLNLNYLQNDLQLPAPHVEDKTILMRHFLYPKPILQLRERGYTIKAPSAVFTIDAFDGGAARKNILGPNYPERLPSIVIGQTPFYPVLTLLFGADRQFFNPQRNHFMNIKNGFKNLANPDKSYDAPTFTYAHMLTPHTPYVISEKGTFAAYKDLLPFSMMERHTGKSSVAALNNDVKKKRLMAQVKGTNALILRMLDKPGFLREKGRPKVILILSDHGSKIHFSAGEIDLNEIFHNLTAVYYSDGNYHGLEKGMTTLNILRHTFKKYFGDPLPKLDDRFYLSQLAYPYALFDVTKEMPKK